MCVTYLYNHMLFTEQSKDEASEANAVFWEKIQDLRQANPEHPLIIKADVQKDRFTQRYCEVLLFECDENEILHTAQRIYEQHFYLIPMHVYPEVQGISEKDVRLGKNDPT